MNKRGDDSKTAWDEGRSKPMPYGKAPHRTSNPLSGTRLDEADRQRLASEQPPPYEPPVVPDKPRKSRAESRRRDKKVVDHSGPRERLPLMVVALLGVLGFLVVGIIALIVINRFFPDWPHRPTAPVETVAAVSRPVPPPAPEPPPPPTKQATTPIGAVKLMLTASLAGDSRTAYAQWDVEPEDIITVERGVPITLAEQTEEAASLGQRARPQDYIQRLLSQSGSEAKVGQYKDNVLTQVYSVRRVGQYWKLYNTTAP
jgi:hypothetical protein